MQQQQSFRAHGTKPSAVECAIYRSPRAIRKGVGPRRSGSARGREEIGQAMRLRTGVTGVTQQNPFMGVFVDLCPGSGVGDESCTRPATSIRSIGSDLVLPEPTTKV